MDLNPPNKRMVEFLLVGMRNGISDGRTDLSTGPRQTRVRFCQKAVGTDTGKVWILIQNFSVQAF